MHHLHPVTGRKLTFLFVCGLVFSVIFTFSFFSHDKKTEAANFLVNLSDGSVINLGCSDPCSGGAFFNSPIFVPKTSSKLASIQLSTSNFFSLNKFPDNANCVMNVYDEDANALIASSDNYYTGSACSGNLTFTFSNTKAALKVGTHYRWEFSFDSMTGTPPPTPGQTVTPKFSLKTNLALPLAIPQPTSLNQFASNGVTPIPRGGTTTSSLVFFKASFQSTSTGQLQLQVEIRPNEEPFTGAFDGGIVTSTFVGLGVTAVASKTNQDGYWNWRARFVDSSGNASNWVEFGNPTATDFRVQTVPIPSDPTILQQQTDGSVTNRYFSTCPSSFGCLEDEIGNQTFVPFRSGNLSSIEIFTSDFASAFPPEDWSSIYCVMYVINNSTGEEIAQSDNKYFGTNCGGDLTFTFNNNHNPLLQAGTRYAWELRIGGLPFGTSLNFLGSLANNVDGIFTDDGLVNPGPMVNAKFVVRGNTSREVPLYTQVVSDFPSLSATQSWFNQTYANGAGTIKPGACGITIAQCGCAITSVVMNARYYGITSDINNQDMNPKNINTWLESTSTGGIMNGYTANGDLKWDIAADYAVDSQIGLKLQHPITTAVSTDGTDLDPVLNQYLNFLEPAILHNDSVGHFFVADGQLGTTYRIKDPAFYRTQTLNDNVLNTTTTHNYQNKFNSIHLYTAVSIAVTSTQDIYLTMSSPAELLITDPNGNRLGVDPISNVSYNEINGAVYSAEGISDGTLANSGTGDETKFAWIPNPISGSYKIQVIGTGSGSYAFESLAYDVNGTAHEQIFRGSTQTGLNTPYNLNYTPQQPNNLTIMSQIIFGGFQPPIKTDGSGIYKQGSILPIKFQLTNASGTIITNHGAQLFVAKIINNVVGSDQAPHSSSVANKTNFFRVTGSYYNYDLDTSSMTPGMWLLKVVLDDGTSHTVVISIKT